MAVRPDGKIVVAGTAAGRGILVARLNSNGTLDTSFGDAATPGHTDVGRSATDTTTALALQPDGQIVVAALTPGPGGLEDFEIERLPADGRSGVGRFQRTIDFGGRDFPYALSLQPDGKIVVAGYSSAGSAPIARLTPDGSLDDSFGDGGKWFVGAGADSPALGLALQADGKIVLAGQSFAPSTNRDHLVARLNSNGPSTARSRLAASEASISAVPTRQTQSRCSRMERLSSRGLLAATSRSCASRGMAPSYRIAQSCRAQQSTEGSLS